MPFIPDTIEPPNPITDQDYIDSTQHMLDGNKATAVAGKTARDLSNTLAKAVSDEAARHTAAVAALNANAQPGILAANSAYNSAASASTRYAQFFTYVLAPRYQNQGSVVPISSDV